MPVSSGGTGILPVESVRSRWLGDIGTTGETPVPLTGKMPVPLTGETPVPLTGKMPVALTGETPVAPRLYRMIQAVETIFAFTRILAEASPGTV